jgi:hypothetical protein
MHSTRTLVIASVAAFMTGFPELDPSKKPPTITGSKAGVGPSRSSL